MYCLIEVAGSNAAHNEEKLNSFLECIMAKSLVVDGTIAQDIKQSKVSRLCHW